MTKKYEIEIEGLPGGWEPIAFKRPKEGEYFCDGDGVSKATFDFKYDYALVVEKIKPQRTVFENTGEIRRPVAGEYGKEGGSFYKCTVPETWTREYEIWREIKE